MRLKRRTRKPQQPQPLPLTEAQIRERAYQLWQANPEGSAESHWAAAIEALQRERSLLGRVGKGWQTAFSTENRSFTLDVLKFVVSAFGVLATIFAGVGLYLTYQNSQAERQLNSERLVTDRFAKAVEQLGSKEPDVRIGAIYSLERIAKDSPKDHWTIMEVLMAFVRNKSSLEGKKQEELPVTTTDVESAMNVIGRRDVKHDPQAKNLPLFLIYLSGTSLEDTNFSGANFNSASLAYVRLNGVQLQGARLIKTSFRFSSLGGANLEGANVEGADFTGAIGIVPNQIKAARNWQKAHYDAAFRQQLGLPPEKTKP